MKLEWNRLLTGRAYAIAMTTLLICSCGSRTNYASYEDCILAEVGSSQTQAAVSAICEACRNKFPLDAKTSDQEVIAAPGYDAKGWTEENTNSTEIGPWLDYSPPGTRFYRNADRTIVRVYPPGVKPNAARANPFGLGDSTEHVPP